MLVIIAPFFVFIIFISIIRSLLFVHGVAMFPSQRVPVKPWHAGVRMSREDDSNTTATVAADLGPKAPTLGGSQEARTALAAIGTGAALRGLACRGDGQ